MTRDGKIETRPCNHCGHVHVFIQPEDDRDNCPDCGGELYPITTVHMQLPTDKFSAAIKTSVAAFIAQGRANKQDAFGITNDYVAIEILAALERRKQPIVHLLPNVAPLYSVTCCKCEGNLWPVAASGILFVDNLATWETAERNCAKVQPK
jgi:hypothetical protein